jgi:subtilisin family serine protease
MQVEDFSAPESPPMVKTRISSCLLVVAMTLGLVQNDAFAQAKITVTDETQLPRFSYPLKQAPSELLVADDATFAPFAAAVGRDVDKTLAGYDIADKSAVRALLQTKIDLAMISHDWETVRRTIAMLRADESKDDARLLAARRDLVYIDAVTAKSDASFSDRYLAADVASTSSLPWATVRDSIREAYAGDRSATRDLIVGAIKNSMDPQFQKSGTLDAGTARGLVSTRALLLYALPYLADDAAVLKTYIAKNAVTKPDIWAARDVTVTAAQAKAPVVIGIWDSGVDPTDYPGSMYMDASGHHGIAFADDATPTTAELLPLPADVANNYARDISLLVGSSDLQSGIDSPDSTAFVTFVRGLSPERARTFEHELDYLGEYTHGSHVAGIASRGNAAARIVNARFDDNFTELVSKEPTMEWVRAMAANFAATGAYFRENHVRVVNMSWGDDVSEFEAWLSKTDPSSDPAERKKKAQEFFAVWRSAIADAIASNPKTLFVASAGNSDSDATFGGTVPAALSYPNLITVGAVDQAGDPANFTSYGPTVVIYADGYHVPSKLPGGYVVRYSGTSMASPNVANLAAKLIALDPSLTPEKVKDLILKGATTSDDGKRKLIDPKATVGLLGS